MRTSTDPERKSLIVVLGMHRSGTSAVTRGLEVLGVELGERLMPAIPGANEKGFFEDIDVNAINLALYQSLGGGQAWHTLAPVSPAALLGEHVADLRRRAMEVLTARTRASSLFGLKDPAMCRLLPFWQDVFGALGLAVSYVIVVRNPISVARSLGKRDGLPPEKCHYLWLQHMLPSVLLTRGAPRVVVDYDRLMDAPENEIARMGRALGFAERLDSGRLAGFSGDFLEERLRHAKYGVEAAISDPVVPLSAKAAFKILADVAADRASLDSAPTAAAFDGLSEQLEGMAQAFRYLVHLDGIITDRDRHIKDLETASRGQVVRYERIVDDVRAEVVQAEHRLQRMRATTEWRFTWPLRALRALWTRLSRRVEVDLVIFRGLQADGGSWRTTGEEPRFLLVAEQAWPRLEGWGRLRFAAARPISAAVLFDTGQGFDTAFVIRFHLDGSGMQEVPLYIPPECRAVRLDLLDAPDTFTLAPAGFGRLTREPPLPPEFAAQSAVYDALGANRGAAGALMPLGDVSPTGEAEYRWTSDEGDPRFTVRGVERKLRPGWCLAGLVARVDIGFGNAKLYFNLGEGYSEADAVILPHNSGQPVERVFRLRARPRRIRFDPVECPAKFTIEQLHLAALEPVAARERMLERLRAHFAPYQKHTVADIWFDIEARARAEGRDAEDLLYRHYNDTYTLYATAQGSPAYEDWIERAEKPEFSLAKIVARQRGFKFAPLISVIMPTYETPEPLLRRAIESVLAQSYPNWELCIADDASTRPHVRAVLEEYARRDPRIKAAFRAENGHISAASNSALAIATGDYVALLDHDDELAPHALHFVVDAINAHPAAEVVYTDEDKVDEHGNRSSPLFKPDWNPDLFLSQNYVSHLGVYRRRLLEAIGGFRVGFEGSQDHDLLLRCLPRIDARHIIHVPRVLYHWRILEGSTAFDSGQKGYAAGAGMRALQDYFKGREQPDVTVEPGLAPNSYRVRYPIPSPEPLVSLLVPTRDKLEFLEPCVRSILTRSNYRNLEILILDNGSVEPATLDFLDRVRKEDARVRVVPWRERFNFSAINNYGVRQARGALIGLINNDTEVISDGWLTEMASHALRPEIGCVGAKLYYRDGTIQHAGVITGLGGVAGHSHKYFPREAPGYFYRLKLIQNLSAVTGACMVVRKSVYEEVGGLDEIGLGIAFNDVDFCLKVREAGYRNLWTPYAELYHYESKSRGTEDTPDRVERFNGEALFMQKKWKDQLARDPCYSPNLTLAREDFSLR